MTRPPTDLRARVVRAAERVLAAKGVVSPIDVLQQMQFLAPSLVRAWEKGHDELLMSGAGREDARRAIAPDLEKVLAGWTAPAGDAPAPEASPVQGCHRSKPRLRAFWSAGTVHATHPCARSPGAVTALLRARSAQRLWPGNNTPIPER